MKKVAGQAQDLSIYYNGAVQNPLGKDTLESMDALEPPGDLT